MSRKGKVLGCAVNTNMLMPASPVLAAQDKMSNYATDIFMPFFDEIQRVTGARAYTDKVRPPLKDSISNSRFKVCDRGTRQGMLSFCCFPRGGC